MATWYVVEKEEGEYCRSLNEFDGTGEGDLPELSDLLRDLHAMDDGSGATTAPVHRLDTPSFSNTPPLPYELNDDAPPPYEGPEDLRSVSYGNENESDWSSDESAWDSDSEGEALALPAPVAIVLGPWSDIEIDSWRVEATGMLWHLLTTCCYEGHIDVNHQLMCELYVRLPVVGNIPQCLPVMVSVLQTLATTEGAETTLRWWSAQEERALPPSPLLPTVRLPSLIPWARSDFWSYATWSMNTCIISRFLAQPMPRSEDDFLETIPDLYRAAAGNEWMVELCVHVLYDVRNFAWSWMVIFRRH